MNINNTSTPDCATMNVYCCGGAGINQGAELPKMPWFGAAGFAALEVVFLDTSISNFRGLKVPQEQIYIFNGKDGSGGQQSANSEVIASAMDDVMLRHPAASYNIVVASISGGSGIVIALNMVRKLLAENALVVFIAIGDTSTGTFADNTVRSLKNLSSTVSKFDKFTLPVTILLNRPGRPCSGVDTAVREYISFYAALFSETLQGLDHSDVFNWANQERLPSGIKAPLTLVSAAFTDSCGDEILIIDDEGNQEHTQVNFDAVVSVLGMHSNRDDGLIGAGHQIIPYATTGYTVETYDVLGLAGNLNLVAHSNVADMYDKINAEKVGVQKVFKARGAPRAIESNNSDTGLDFS